MPGLTELAVDWPNFDDVVIQRPSAPQSSATVHDGKCCQKLGTAKYTLPIIENQYTLIFSIRIIIKPVFES